VAHFFYETYPYSKFGFTIHTAGLEAARALKNWRVEVDNLRYLTHFHYFHQAWDEAIKYSQQAAQIFEQQGEMREQAVTYHFLGSLFYEKKGEYEKAIEAYKKAWHLFKQLSEHQGMITTCYDLSSVYFKIGQEEKGFEFAVEAAEQRGNINDLAWGYYRASGINYTIGHFEEAIKLLKRSLALYRNLGNQYQEGIILSLLGKLYHTLGQFTEAFETYDKALAIVPNYDFLYNNLVRVYLDMGKLEDTVLYFHEQIKRCSDDALEAHVSLGVIAFYQGDNAEAKHHFEMALNADEVAEGKKGLYSKYDILEYKALAWLGLGQVEEAVMTLKEALDQRTPSYTSKFTLYDLLSQAPNPPQGLAEIRQLLEETRV
jgi:tetratricopeptide (TPR) repeat protein